MKLKLLLILALVSLFACTREYKRTMATITDLKIEGGVNKASIEYFVDSVRYTGEFSISTKQMIEDSITMPYPGLTFEILYNSKNPVENEIEFNVKPVYKSK